MVGLLLKMSEEEPKELLTDEFLETLVKAAETCGNSVDYIELIYFVQYCFDVAEKDMPNLEIS